MCPKSVNLHRIRVVFATVVRIVVSYMGGAHVVRAVRFRLGITYRNVIEITSDVKIIVHPVHRFESIFDQKTANFQMSGPRAPF